ncbi:hypothetical protein [Synechococcus sp. CCY 9618]|uniref:hypothetical protein n=1 Tax=Synechococcus sp. CCY 9618 TaxID=2815602 RepID=UPI001C24BC40|nr:hypothetical protein [Synechococcus sp. CCY 9618]
MSNKPRRLLICVTFHFMPSRLIYLKQIAAEFPNLADSVKTVIITNDGDAHDRISSSLDALPLDLEILTPSLLGHPYLLAWCHKDVFRRELELQSHKFSHYLYLEDDILIDDKNISYWMEARERLKPSGLIPSFVRYEINHSSQLRVSADLEVQVDPAKAAKILFPDLKYAYVGLPNPYQGTYLFDGELLAEHFESIYTYGPEAPAPDEWKYTREKAALGVTFHRVPYGFDSRNVVGYRVDAQRVDERSLIHHTPNNYANNPSSRIGKVSIKDLISPPITLPRRRTGRHYQPDGSVYQLPRPSFQEYAKSTSKLARKWFQC